MTAEQIKTWLDADPARAEEIINAGLAMLAVHGWYASNGEPLEWSKVPRENGPEFTA